jgi:hypothetical protein
VAVARGHLELSLRRVEQLFNSMDPAPFGERDLDLHAERYLVDWARELPSDAALSLSLHLQEAPSHPEGWIETSVHRYFVGREHSARGELRALLRQGRISLMIGLSFLGLCLYLSQWLLRGADEGFVGGLLRESLTVAGWVAMWRPMQTYLYDWWPLRAQAHLYRRMSRMPVRVLVRTSEKAQERRLVR